MCLSHCIFCETWVQQSAHIMFWLWIQVPKPDRAAHLETRCSAAPHDEKQQALDVAEQSDINNDGLVPCNACGRRFFRDRIATHERICQKVSLRARPIFHSERQRQIEDDKDFRPSQRRQSALRSEPFSKDGSSFKTAQTASSVSISHVATRNVKKETTADTDCQDIPRTKVSLTPKQRAQRQNSATTLKNPRLQTQSKCAAPCRPMTPQLGRFSGVEGRPKIITSNVTSRDNPLLTWSME